VICDWYAALVEMVDKYGEDGYVDVLLLYCGYLKMVVT